MKKINLHIRTGVGATLMGQRGKTLNGADLVVWAEEENMVFSIQYYVICIQFVWNKISHLHNYDLCHIFLIHD